MWLRITWEGDLFSMISTNEDEWVFRKSKFIYMGSGHWDKHLRMLTVWISWLPSLAKCACEERAPRTLQPSADSCWPPIFSASSQLRGARARSPNFHSKMDMVAAAGCVWLCVHEWVRVLCVLLHVYLIFAYAYYIFLEYILMIIKELLLFWKTCIHNGLWRKRCWFLVGNLRFQWHVWKMLPWTPTINPQGLNSYWKWQWNCSKLLLMKTQTMTSRKYKTS